MGIYIKSMGAMQGCVLLAGFFEICENRENRLKLIEMDNSLHLWIIIEKKSNNTIIYVTQYNHDQIATF